MSRIWRTLIQKASLAALGRQTLTPEALLGRQGEEAAYWHLREHGFTMVDRNYRADGMRGEIDLIGWEKDTLVFVEVKTRASSEYRSPEAAVDHEKQRHIARVARAYRRQAGRQSCPYRFDVVAVVAHAGAMKIEHFRDVFREPAMAPTKG